MDTLIPPSLIPGDKVAIIATAKNFEKESIASAFSVIQGWGFVPVAGPNLYKKHFEFAGTDSERLSDLQWAIDHPEIRAILFARGGYGTGRIIDKADLKPLLSKPKWLIGFSDLTVLHFSLQKLNLASLHGPMAITFRNSAPECLHSLKNVLTGEYSEITINGSSFNKTGSAKGKIIGGNLSIINNLIATASDFDYTGKILFLEEISEYLYHLDRMMVHLKRSGKLEGLAGIISGQFSAIKDNQNPFGNSWQEIILDAVKDYSFPVCFNFEGGHENLNIPIILGMEAHLEVGKNQSVLNYSLNTTVRTV